MELNLSDYSEYRYNLKSRIDRMHNRRKAAIRKQVMNVGVPYSSYYTYINLKKDDKRDIDATYLRAFAKALNTEMELLFNE